jgi:formate-dependent nitrite reductase membrane component NrfD
VSVSDVTKGGLRNTVPETAATTGVNLPAGVEAPARKRRRDEPEFRSYYDLPVLNKPVWESPDIPGYLFLGGLAGAGAVVGAAAQLTGRPALARVSKVTAAAAGQLSLVALVHDLGRRRRFLNMLRVFKVTSPMSVGSWFLAGFVPAVNAAALCDVTGLLPGVGALATASSAVLGPPVATYTAALISNTAVPAWHDGHRLMPFVFATSALSSAAGVGLLAAPLSESAVLRPLAAGAGVAEVALTKAMQERMGIVKEAYEKGRAKKYMRIAEILLGAGAVVTATSGRSRVRAALGGAALLAGSALTRFGIFEAGIESAEDPKYTVVPQRQRLAERESGSRP